MCCCCRCSRLIRSNYAHLLAPALILRAQPGDTFQAYGAHEHLPTSERQLEKTSPNLVFVRRRLFESVGQPHRLPFSPVRCQISCIPLVCESAVPESTTRVTTGETQLGHGDLGAVIVCIVDLLPQLQRKLGEERRSCSISFCHLWLC